VTDCTTVAREVCSLDVKIKTSKEKSEVNKKLKSSKDRDPAVGT
jgi:hypothetical protein